MAGSVERWAGFIGRRGALGRVEREASEERCVGDGGARACREVEGWSCGATGLLWGEEEEDGALRERQQPCGLALLVVGA